jgi:hypothetical protein
MEFTVRIPRRLLVAVLLVLCVGGLAFGVVQTVRLAAVQTAVAVQNAKIEELRSTFKFLFDAGPLSVRTAASR